MASYQAPLADMRFVLHDLLDVERRFAELPGHQDLGRDLIDQILGEAARVCEDVVAPTSRAGDVEGCRLEDGHVHVPGAFKDAYRALAEGGWTSLACAEEHGGQGLPGLLHAFVDEMTCSANMALSLYPGLTYGAYIAISRFGDEELKRRYLPRMTRGEWTGTMCLTEAHCGTDLGLLRTRAVPDADGTYRVSGTKIFITGGDQDLTDNVVHLVLARLPDAPPGVKGISMFLVPKRLPDAEGGAGEPNGVRCLSIEHKLGIHGASTCVMEFDAARGWLVGAAHRGLQAMFSMMNHERLMVGQQGLAQAEAAYQNAARYARERLQGRALGGARHPDLAADPIIVHPDVRRMLLDTRAHNEAARALFGWVRLQVDVLEKHPEPAVRERADDLVALLIPVVKAYFTDYGSAACNQCLQVFGGHGYIAETGMEQLVRDVRIAQIYEGANGIQALDLTARKLFMREGRLIARYLEEVEGFLGRQGSDPRIAEFAGPLGAALATLREASAWLRREAQDDPELVGAVASEYLNLLALTAFAHMWTWSAAVAAERAEADNSGFYAAKLATGRYFMARVLPRIEGHWRAMRAGSAPLMALPAEAF